MIAVTFEPHQDDCTLFVAYESMRLRAHVVTVLESQLQLQRGLGITQQQRRSENDCAMRELGLEWTQWPYSDADPDWDAVLAAMRALDDRMQPDVVLAPESEDGGHEQHSRIGDLAGQVFGGRCRFYLTYRRGYGRTVGEPVLGTTDQIGRKMRALACHRSQITEPSTRPWFLDGVTEWMAA